MDRTKPTTFDRFWESLSHFGNLQLIASAALACLATARKLAGQDAAWGPYVVALAGSWFFGTLLVLILATRLVRALIWARQREKVTVLAYGGDSGALRITRLLGPPAEIVVEANAVTWSGANPLEERPFVVTWEYEGDQRVFPQEQQLASAHLADGAAASVVLVKREAGAVSLQGRQPGANVFARVLPASAQEWPSIEYAIRVSAGSETLYRGSATFRLDQSSNRVVAVLSGARI